MAVSTAEQFFFQKHSKLLVNVQLFFRLQCKFVSLPKRGGRTDINLVSIKLMKTIQFDRQITSSLLKQMHFSFTCFHPVIFKHFPLLIFNHKLKRPSQDVTIQIPQQMTISIHIVCHNRLNYCFMQTQHLH